ncbi:hypothetical protein CPB83DRAFT_848815 [Crepidotus variabilis]|uniref:Uncharacterized protein n=1 Tax=Crepidotus variabilis TaxID=179855 RepID=A0A9P6EK90_9AGAR|nr:hypothetical protein CPB83DRAFT_848815 [Crepidotus variabilis]
MPDVVARPFTPVKVVLPSMPDVVARPFTPDRVPSIIIPLGLRINTDTPLSSKHSPLPSSTYSPARNKGYIQSPATASSTRPSPLTQQPEAPSSSFLDLSQTPATPSVLSLSHEHSRLDSPPPPVPPKPSHQEISERVNSGSTRPLYIQLPKQKVRKVKSAPMSHRFSRVLHICHRNNEGSSRSGAGSNEDALPPAYTEPEWSFWDGESPRRSRFTQ